MCTITCLCILLQLNLMKHWCFTFLKLLYDKLIPRLLSEGVRLRVCPFEINSWQKWNWNMPYGLHLYWSLLFMVLIFLIRVVDLSQIYSVSLWCLYIADTGIRKKGFGAMQGFSSPWCCTGRAPCSRVACLMLTSSYWLSQIWCLLLEWNSRTLGFHGVTVHAEWEFELNENYFQRLHDLAYSG